MRRRLTSSAALFLFFLSLPLAPSPPPPLRSKALPRLFLWAWERREDLSFVDPDQVGVAYLAGTVRLRGDETLWLPRMQPLGVPEGAAVVGVVRVEWSPKRPPACSAAQAERLSNLLLRVAAKPGLRGLQVDYDAPLSQRSFYRSVLQRVRGGLRPDELLSVTALASWRLDEGWACSLPVDEAVVMLFRMGPAASEVRRQIREGVAPCSARPDAFGVSLDEAAPVLPAGGRLYCFNRRSWTSGDLHRLKENYLPGVYSRIPKSGIRSSVESPLEGLEESHAVQR